jgi:(R,R)-butanediol dehydrogenase/meso-butanediol dehydrogenase/diacetyl reductase
MRAVVLYGRDDIRLEEVPVPEPGPGEVRLRVETVGLCGTDLAELTNGPRQFPIETQHPVTGHLGPMIPGHEVSGRIDVSGPGVSGLHPGDLVATTGSWACGRCRHCGAGRRSRCVEHWTTGLHRDGALADYVIVPAGSCLPVGSMAPDTAVLAQPMSIGVHATRRGRIAAGELVLVIGIGGAGVFVTHAAVSAGCEVVAIDIDPGRLGIARSIGVAAAMEAQAAPLPPDVDVVFEVTGSAAGWQTAMSAMGPRTRLVPVGFQKQPFAFDFAALTLAEQEIIGTNGIDPPVDLPEAVRLLSLRSWSDVAPTVRPLEDVPDVLHLMAVGDAPIKSLVSPLTDRERPAVT